MYLIDTNAYLGHYAARRLRYNTPEGLLQLMDRAGIAKACVSSASAICYRNSHAGNEEMWEMLTGVPCPSLGQADENLAAAGAEDAHKAMCSEERHVRFRERLIPFVVLNPAYAGWEKDLRWSYEVMGAKGLRLFPSWHNYRLSDSCCHDLIQAAAELGMIISIPQRIEDYRQRHWLLDTPDVSLADIAKAIAAHPNAKFLVTNAIGAGASDLVLRKDELPANYWIDICRPDVVYTKEAERLVEALGEERIVFGSGIPFNYPEPAIIRMEVLRDLGYDVAKIGYGNIAALLNISCEHTEAGND